MKFVKEDVEKAMGAVDIWTQNQGHAHRISQVFAKSFLTTIHPDNVSMGDLYWQIAISFINRC